MVVADPPEDMQCLWEGFSTQYGQTNMMMPGQKMRLKTCIAIVEQCPETGVYVGVVPGFPDIDVQAETLDELYHDLHEVIDMLLEDTSSVFKCKLFSLQTCIVA
jgi:predicted RNase H-like HicB family nuclease